LFIFRNEIARRIGLNFPSIGKRITAVLTSRQSKRVQALIAFGFIIWILTDIIWLFVFDIIKVVKESKDDDNFYGFWWQDPISDSIIVI